MVIANSLDLILFQFDVASAYLQSPIVEEIYVAQPEGFGVIKREREVYRLHKCLYRLRQASPVWSELFDAFLSEFGLTPSISDPCLYLYQHGSAILIVALWVDDGLAACNTPDLLEKILTHLKTQFFITPRAADLFVGLHITRNF